MTSTPASPRYTAVRGMNDVLPQDSAKWLWVESVVNKVMASYAYKNIRTPLVDRLTFALGTGIAGVAGAAFTTIGSTGPDSGSRYIVDTFLVVVFGGAASLFGTIAAAFGIAQGQSITGFFLEGTMGKVAILMVIVVVLMIRPQGLFSSKVRS